MNIMKETVQMEFFPFFKEISQEKWEPSIFVTAKHYRSNDDDHPASAISNYNSSSNNNHKIRFIYLAPVSFLSQSAKVLTTVTLIISHCIHFTSFYISLILQQEKM